MSAPDPAALIGTVLGEGYRLDALIGRGGFGAVFRATDTRLDRPVAVKVALQGHDPRMAQRFRREAQAQAGLRHAGIVRLLAFGMHDDMPYIVQEFVDGRTLRAVVDAEGPLDVAQARAIFGQLLAALDEAHAQGVVHRDIKPENIMLVDGRQGEEVRLLDFGIAKLIERDDHITSLTPQDAIIGSVSWLTPEQASGSTITPRTDLYAVGCVMFWALTGQKPFEGPMRRVVLAHLSQPPPPLPEQIPADIAACVHRAMRKVPEERHVSALAMAQALAADGASGPAVQRRSRRGAVVALAIVLLILATAAGLTLTPSAPPPDAGAPAVVVVGAPLDAQPPSPDMKPSDALPLNALPLDARAPDATSTPRPKTAPSTTRFDRALAACDCAAATREHRALVRRGVDRSAALKTACGPSGKASRCGRALQARVEKAMRTCPCHGEPTATQVKQLKSAFGIDLRTRWTQRCVQPGLPGSCIQPVEQP